MPADRILQDKQTVRDVLAMCPRLGVPHFQRGLVWDDSAVSLLLESLYHDTPIGSLVLWECADPSLGVSWLGSEPFDHLIIDGQQRIRSLHQVFGCVDDHGSMAEGAKGARVWCVNLRRTTEFERYLGTNPKEQSLFVNVLKRDLRDAAAAGSPETTGGAPSRFQTNFVRLQWLLDGRIDDIVGRIGEAEADTGELRAAASVLVEHSRALLKREAFIRIERNSSLAKIVGIYNRINSAGKRVEAEERAFAAMVAFDPGTAQEIDDLFRRLHPASQPQGMERDHALRRQKERSFGFKLFMRTFAQVCAYHFGSQSGAEAFSFDFFHSATFAAKARSADFRLLWDSAAKAIAYVHDLLGGEDLCCDDLRFLPETSSLVPIFQLLIRFPLLTDASQPGYQVYRRKVAALCLQLVLAELPQNKVAALVRIAGDVRAKDAGETIRKMQAYDRGKGVDLRALSERLAFSNSLQGRYVLLLYWLERSLNARDFSYSSNKEQLARPESFQGITELLIDRSAEAERQHLVPYARLRGLYGDLRELSRRMGTHKANNIGNITYISHRLNSYDEGVGENALNLGGECPANLRAHFLSDITPAMNSAGSFEAFCGERREAIARGFLAWLDRLSDEALTEVPAPSRIKPTPAEYADYAHMADEIRALQFDDEVEELLVDISCACRRMPIRGKHGAAGLRMGKKGLWVITIHHQTRTILVRPEADAIVEHLRTDCPEVVWSKGRDTDLAVGCRQTLTILRDLCV